MITQGDRIKDNKATSHMLLKECGVDDASSTPKKKKTSQASTLTHL